MKKKLSLSGNCFELFFLKKFKTMKLLILLTLFVGLQGSFASVYSQNTLLSLKKESTSVREILRQIEKQSEFTFMYDNNKIDVDRKVKVEADKVTVEKILDKLFNADSVQYEIIENHVILKVSDMLNQQQDKTVVGTVTDINGSPLPGVSVVIKGTTTGVITDSQGHYVLEVRGSGDILIFSFVGMENQEITYTNQNNIDVRLKESNIALMEVVAIGYGTQKKSDITGSVSSVKSDQLVKIPTSGTASALQGMAPGLSVDFNDGTPGKDPELLVRGITSWSSSNKPLVIIDGVPGDIKFLNPEEIKSLSVLKDAATAAIYGSRSAAGVILIETNRGEKSKPKIQFSAYTGIDDLPKRMDVCNSAEYINVNKMALTNANIPTSKWPGYIAAYEADPSQFADTDWQKEFYRTGISKKYNLGYSAGNEVSNISFSGFYSKTEGIIKGTDASKMGFRLNSDMHRGKFTMGESVSYGRSEDHPEIETGFPGMWQTTNIQPLISVYDDNNEGGFGGAVAGLGMTDASNPVAFNQLIDEKNSTDHIKVSGYIKYELIKDLIMKFQAGRSMDFKHYKNFTPTYFIGVYDNNEKASMTELRSKELNDLLELTINYNKTLDKHDFSGVVGLSQEEYMFRDLSASASKFENNDLRLLSHGQENFTVGGQYYRSGLQSAFGRFSYNYDLKYLMMVSCRYDGSSKFGEGNKWGFFPSLSLGWNMSNEPFWGSLKETVNVLKLRASYGVLGNQSIGTYKYIPEMSYDNNDINYPLGSGQDIRLGYTISSLPSFSIRWEKTLYKNIGFDAALFNNQIEMSFELYEKYTSDMLTHKPISVATGVSTYPIVNEGELQTKGWEFQLTYRNRVRDFKYNIALNLSHYNSVLKKMADEGYINENGPARTYVGGQIGEFWVYETDGLFRSQQDVELWNQKNGYEDANGTWIPLQPAAAPGDVRFVDQNGDGILDSDDKINVGCGTPDLTMGLNINLIYGDFDLVANFFGAFGHKRYNYMKRQLQRMDKHFNYGKAALNAWTPSNSDSNIPRAVIGDPNNNNRLSTRYMEKGDYLRLNNLQLGYTLPKSAASAIGIDNLRVYVGGLRLLTFTNYDGYDPGMTGDLKSRGVDQALYPLSRTYVMGLQFGF